MAYGQHSMTHPDLALVDMCDEGMPVSAFESYAHDSGVGAIRLCRLTQHR